MAEETVQARFEEIRSGVSTLASIGGASRLETPGFETFSGGGRGWWWESRMKLKWK